MFDYDDIQGIERRIRDMEEATKLARSSGLMDSVKRVAELRPSVHETAAFKANEAAARLREDPTRQVLKEDVGQRQQMFEHIKGQVDMLPDVEQRQQMFDRIRAQVETLPDVSVSELAKVNIGALPGVDVNALASAERVAAQALKSYDVPNFEKLLPTNVDQLKGLLDRASDLATAPGTQELLRRADEVTASGRIAEQPDSVDLDDLPSIPELDWMAQLDRDSLIFLCRILYHLLGILSPALGVGVALSDGNLDGEDWPEIVQSLSVTFFYAMTLLKKTDE